MMSLVTESPVITAFHSCWRRPEVKFGQNLVKEETTQKNYQDEDKKVRNKIKINSQIKKPHLKMIPIKDNCQPLLGYLMLNSGGL